MYKDVTGGGCRETRRRVDSVQALEQPASRWGLPFKHILMASLHQEHGRNDQLHHDNKRNISIARIRTSPQAVLSASHQVSHPPIQHAPNPLPFQPQP